MSFFYTPTGYPIYGSQSNSALDRAELALIQAAFDRFATPTGYATHMVKVKDDESGYDFSVATLTTAGVMAGLTGVTSTGTINFGSATSATLPATTVGALSVGGALNLNGNIASNAGNAVAASDVVNLQTAQALLSGGGTPSNIPITSLGVGTVNDGEVVMRSGGVLVGRPQAASTIEMNYSLHGVL